MAITRAKDGYHTFHAGTPNWRRPHHLESSKCFNDWRELQLLKSQRVAPGSKCSDSFRLQIAIFSGCTGVNQVAQSGGIIAIASSTIQGGDDSFPTVDNMGPSLIFWERNSGIDSFHSLKGATMIDLFVRIPPNVHSHKILWHRYSPPR